MSVGRVEDIDDSEMRLMESEKDLNIKLMRTMAKLSDAEDALKRWRAELEIVASKGGHNLCHIWITEILKRTLGHTGNFPDPKKLTKEQFKLSCKFYQDDIFGLDKVPLCSGKMFDRQAVFLDRDGTVIESIHRPDFVKKITAPFLEDELKFMPKAYLAVSKLKDEGFLRILVTDQPDVRHDYLEEKIWRRIQNRVQDTLGLDDIFMCRHLRDDNCPLKKPSPLMLQAAADKWGIDLSQSWMVGDTEQDMKTGRAAGCKVVLISWEYNMGLKDSEYDHRAGSLMEAVDIIISSKKQV